MEVSQQKTIATLIVAAGLGSRAGDAGGLPKQYRSIGGRAVLARALDPFLRLGLGPILVAINPHARALYSAALGADAGRVLPPVEGEETRQGTVLAGLEALAAHHPDAVLIHDAARPMISEEVILRVVSALKENVAVIPALAVADTLKRASGGVIEETVNRARLYAAQTPQGFDFKSILHAHRRAAASGLANLTDDAEVAQHAGIPVQIVDGDARNRKLTTAQDIEMARIAVEANSMLGLRVGSGFDVHRLGPGDHVWLCGVRIPHGAGLVGHSDADVGLHAIVDALLGAIAEGDIGVHFPPSDERWRGMASAHFLAEAHRRVTARGGKILNVDVTILCETPRIGPHREAMRARIGAILGVDVSHVSVKATTTEGLGFTGRREGIAAQASATVLLPT